MNQKSADNWYQNQNLTGSTTMMRGWWQILDTPQLSLPLGLRQMKERSKGSVADQRHDANHNCWQELKINCICLFTLTLIYVL